MVSMLIFWALGLKGLTVLEHVRAAFSPRVFGVLSSERFSTFSALGRGRSVKPEAGGGGRISENGTQGLSVPRGPEALRSLSCPCPSGLPLLLSETPVPRDPRL